MSKIFSILQHIDFKEYKYDPIILMSPDTLKEMSIIEEDLGFCISKSTCNNCTDRIGTYEGIKVFTDPSMKYGEVFIVDERILYEGCKYEDYLK